MEKVSDQFKINLNQNLWVLVTAFFGLGFAEYFELKKLMSLSYLLSIISMISICATLFFYTVNYCKGKVK